MYEEKTYENLLREKLSRVDARYDRREGSVIYDAMAPNSAEAAQIYMELGWMFDQMSGDTAEREYLARIAYDTRGIRPKEAAYAVLKGVFDRSVPIGSRYSLDELNYTVLSVIDDTAHTYRLQCETTGTEGNRHIGNLIPVEYISGLTRAELTEVLIPGEDEEDTEAFRQRWREAFRALSFAGNKADYREKIKGIDGVGGVKVMRASNEAGELTGGHVRCVVIASDYRAPSQELVNNVQTIIDPAINAGEGDGLAPIGHEVHILPVQEIRVSVTANITYEAGYSYDAVKSYINASIDGYFGDLAKAWEETEQLVVRISQIEARLLEQQGIVDIQHTALNGTEQNVTLDACAIPIRGDVHG